VQREIWTGLEHRLFGGVRVLARDEPDHWSRGSSIMRWCYEH